MDSLRHTLDGLRIGSGITTANLTVFPLLGGADGTPDYLTLDEALGAAAIEITETSEAGAVPELRLRNRGDRRVLLVDGEELVGAKQNRVLNVTILAAAASEIVIPVSCVEMGRWDYRSRRFDSAPRAQYARARARKTAQVSESLHASDGHDRRGDQSDLWADIDAKAARLATRSDTGAMGAMYDTHARRLEDYVAGIAPRENQVGALFAIGDSVVGLDLFDHPATLARLLPKFARGYALDALDALESGAKVGGVADQASARAFLDRMGAATVSRFSAVGEGEELRLSADDLAGAALVVDDRVVHLCGFLRQRDA